MREMFINKIFDKVLININKNFYWKTFLNKLIYIFSRSNILQIR